MIDRSGRYRHGQHDAYDPFKSHPLSSHVGFHNCICHNHGLERPHRWGSSCPQSSIQASRLVCALLHARRLQVRQIGVDADRFWASRCRCHMPGGAWHQHTSCALSLLRIVRALVPRCPGFRKRVHCPRQNCANAPTLKASSMYHANSVSAGGVTPTASPPRTGPALAHPFASCVTCGGDPQCRD